VTGVDPQDLLVDRDRLGVEALGREDLGDLGVRLDRELRLTPLELQVADAKSDVRVLRVGLKQLRVLAKRLLEGALLDVFLRRLEGLALVQRKSQDEPRG
jgi:hypothetical protein